MPSTPCQRLLATARHVLAVALLVLTAPAVVRGASPAASSRPPNFVLIYVDDMGYGDLGCFGSKLIDTPRLDRMAREGLRLTSFYNGAPLCAPSRLALMTGCYPLRPAIPEIDRHRHFHPVLHNEEVTVAEVLNAAGYRTMAIGKWHLSGNGRMAIGDERQPEGLDQFFIKHPRLMPTAQGFNSYFGIPYSNDMNPLVLMRDDDFVEFPVDQTGITTRYTDEALRFITTHRDEPFFLYLAHNMPHTPLYPAPEFEGRSAYGLYGDCVEEIDHNVGRILDHLAALDLDENTLVVFTSDNGPWIEPHPDPARNRTPAMRHSRLQSGTAGPLRGMKMTSWEGGPRVPCIVRFPGVVPAGRTSDELTTAMDLFPTFAGWAGASLPFDRVIDGRDLAPLLTGTVDRGPHDFYYYYQYTHLLAVRDRRYKLVLPREEHIPSLGWYGRLSEAVEAPQLYDLAADIDESTDISAEHPDLVARLQALAAQARRDLGDHDRLGAGQRGDYRWETKYGSRPDQS